MTRGASTSAPSWLMITSPEANLSRRPATASVGIRFENVSYRKMSEGEQRETHRKEIINNLVVRRLSCEGAHVVQRLVNGNIKPIERNGERAQRTCRCALVRKGNLLAIDKRLVRGNELTDALHAFVAMSEAILFQERLGAVSGANGTRFPHFHLPSRADAQVGKQPVHAHSAAAERGGAPPDEAWHAALGVTSLSEEITA